MTVSTTEDEIAIVTLPPEAWQAFREIRLEALRMEPEAFGSAYEEAVPMPEETWRGRLEKVQAGGADWMFFAKHGEHLVGMLSGYRHGGIKMRHIAEVNAVYVRAAFRGRGVGTRLMETLLSTIAAEPGIVKFRLAVNPRQAAAVRLYQHFGFRMIGTAAKELFVNGVYHDEYLMEKLI